MTARAPMLMCALCALLGGCTQTVDPTPREISIRPLYKPSCERVCGSTCLACVDSLQVYATDSNGANAVEPQCHDIRGHWETLCDLLIGTRLTVLTEVPTKEPVVVVLRALRNSAAITPDAGPDGGLQCVAPVAPEPWLCQTASNDLMLWGRSRPTDLSPDAGAQWIEVEIECRAGCDCLDIGRKPTCPTDLRPSACLSRTSDLRTLNCEKECGSDQKCFEGALRCDVDAGRCDPVIQNPTEPLPFCARCQHDTDCADNLCVGRANEDGGYGYCSRSCPDYACPQGASCAPVDDLSGYRRLY